MRPVVDYRLYEDEMEQKINAKPLALYNRYFWSRPDGSVSIRALVCTIIMKGTADEFRAVRELISNDDLILAVYEKHLRHDKPIYRWIVDELKRTKN